MGKERRPMADVACAVCTRPMRVHRSRLDRTSHPTCSRTCKGLAHSRVMTGRGSGRVRVTCRCGAAVAVWRSRAALGHPVSCSTACANGIRRAKLTADTVREIRRRLDDGETMAQLAWEYRVASSTISAVRTGLTWGWVS